MARFRGLSTIAIFLSVGCSEDEPSRPSVQGGAAGVGGAGGSSSNPRSTGGSSAAGDASFGGAAGNEAGSGGQGGSAIGGQGGSNAQGGSGGFPTSGLRADYYNGAYFIEYVFKRVDPSVDYTFGSGGPTETLFEKFSIRWTGFVTPQFSEEYVFSVVSDDGVKLWIDSKLVIDKWVTQPVTENSSAPIALEAGKHYAIRLDYFDRESSAEVHLRWASVSEPKSIVPEARLTPADMTPDPRFATYEAETSVLGDGAVVTDCSPCSPNGAGRRVDLTVPFASEDPVSTLQFEGITVPEPKNYTLRVWFANEGPPTSGAVKINDGSTQAISFRTNTKTGGSSVFEDMEVQAPFVEGKNTVVVVGPRDSASLAPDDRVRIDRITIDY